MDNVLSGQMNILDFLHEEHKFAPIIDDLAKDLHKLLYPNEYEEKYEVWDHVPYLGYRYSLDIKINLTEREFIINKLKELKEKYKKHKLEISIMQTPYFVDNNKTTLHISTLWEDKKRAKNG